MEFTPAHDFCYNPIRLSVCRKGYIMNKNKNVIHNQKHLTLSNRNYIEQELLQRSSFKDIASVLHKDPSTISKEVRLHRKFIKGRSSAGHCQKCKFHDSCTTRGHDPEVRDCRNSKWCNNLCHRCWREHPTDFCSTFIPIKCSQPNRFPYVCNACENESKCRLDHYIYLASHAQLLYEKTLVKSRQGINMTPEELQELNELISPLILKGQPLSHIFAVHADEIPVCRRTLYN